MSIQRILIIILVILFQDSFGVAKEPIMDKNKKADNPTSLNIPRIRNAAATEEIVLRPYGHRFFFDPTKWNIKYAREPSFIGDDGGIDFIGDFGGQKSKASIIYSPKAKSVKAQLDKTVKVLRWKHKNDKTIHTSQIISQEQCIINGAHVLIARIDFTSDGQTKSLYECFYSGKGGTVDIISRTTPDQFPKQVTDFEDFFNGLITERIEECPTIELRKVWLDKYKPMWTEVDRLTVAERKIKLGLTEDQAEISWGIPESKNNTVTQYSKRTQWVYGSSKTYLYFENGKLTAWQD
jgi:hypothetical protein